MTLDRLATQAVLHSQGKADESWISAGQLRDDVLRNEFSAKRRDEIWKRVKAVVEENANVRASVRETRAGDISRVWEWIGSLGAIEDGDRGGRRSLGSPVTNEKPSPGDDSKDWVEVRRWDEGRPIY
ncbi:inner nuclear membrane protein enriched at telomere/subtelomere region [Loxospora ochrophaea]|nr:inner nuclear membrane protein enriched at telomere/subtelomere region [Loxospora ochrophaea]